MVMNESEEAEIGRLTLMASCCSTLQVRRQKLMEAVASREVSTLKEDDDDL